MSNRFYFTLIAFISLISILYAFYAQYFLHLIPCPLCIAERVMLIFICLLSLILSGLNLKNYYINKFFAIVIIGLSAFNIKIAAHHLWLINLPPDQQPISCGMPLAVLFDRLPLNQFIDKILQGDAECGRVTWKILGMHAPLAVIVLCSIIILICLLLLIKAKPASKTY